MHKTGKRYLKFLAITALLLPVVPRATRAADDSEKELSPMALYFDQSQLVEVATRTPKSISQVAENVSIITAADIERMHVHSLTDVLEQVPGVFIDSSDGGKDFSSLGTLSIQGSDYEQVTVLLDGVRLNMPAAGIIYTNIVPLSIIKRIEVIKGAASSTWGSALGGVVNIVTKDTGDTVRPVGDVYGSFGESESQDDGIEGAGRVGAVKYYLFTGDQNSDGIRASRYFDQSSLYGKLQLPLSAKFNITLASAYADQDSNPYSFKSDQFYLWARHRLFLSTLGLDGALADHLSYHVSLHRLADDFYTRQSYAKVPASDNYDQATTGADLRLVWQPGNHTVVLGAESSRAREIDQADYTAYGLGAPYDSPITAPPIYEGNQAFYLNDTWQLGSWFLIPGLRYDYSSIFKDKVSPSLGMVYRWSKTTLFRAQVGKGFRRPALNMKRGDPDIYFAPPSLDLEPENAWTYQAGVESTALSYVRLKTTLFYHRSTDSWQWDSADAIWTNSGGVIIRKGIELEAETVPLHGFTLAANYTFVHEAPDNGVNGRQWAARLIAKYDNGRGFTARLFGNYVWWGAYWASIDPNGAYSDILWEFSLEQRLLQSAHTATTAFFAVHNLFSGNDSLGAYDLQAPRWIEAGLRLAFR